MGAGSARWDLVQRLLDDVLQLPAAERRQAVELRCGGDEELRRELHELLAATEESDPLFETDRLPGRLLQPGARAAGSGHLDGPWGPHVIDRLIAERYRVVERLAEGGSGVVFRARDTLTGDDVALKGFCRPRAATPRNFRREVGLLRALRLPGVVALLDEGELDGFPFIVTELIEGAPFPGRSSGAAWADLAAVVHRLLDALERVHWAGVLHRDLKPANVLVDGAGQPTILDLGIARDHDARSREVGVRGTPAYLSPEQLAGAPATVRSDLYAVGLMLYEALAGQPAHPPESLEGLIAARLRGAPPARAALEERAPVGVVDVVLRLLEREPCARPESVAVTRALLRAGHAGPSRGPADPQPTLGERLDRLEGAPGPFAEATLQALFHGPDRLLHLREDAAHELWRRTKGRGGTIAAELEAWTRAGLARWEGGRLRVARSDLLRLAGGLRVQSPVPPGLLVQLVSRGSDAAIAAAARDAARAALEAGRLEQGAWAAREGLIAARRLSERALERDLLDVCLHLAFERETGAALEAFVSEAARARQPEGWLGGRETLVRAALWALGGSPQRALDALDALGPLTPAPMERWRWAVILIAARKVSAELEGARETAALAWADARPEPQVIAAAATWRGWRHYRELNFREAALCHARAAEVTRHRAARIAALLNGAAAWLEEGALAECDQLARRARADARDLRHGHYEARAEWLLRAAAYRGGAATGVDEELLEAVTHAAAPLLVTLTTLTEAGIALRARRSARALELARNAVDSARRANNAMTSLWARALAAHCGDAEQQAEAEEIARESQAGLPPGLTLQILALLAEHLPRSPTQQDARALATAIPAAAWDQRREILSVSESLARISGASGA